MGGSDSKQNSRYSVPISSSISSGSPIYTHPSSASNITLPKIWGCTNYSELFLSIASKFPNRPWLGLEYSNNYEWLTYGYGCTQVFQVSNGLNLLNFQENSLGFKLLGIISSPRVEFFIADLASLNIGLVTVGLAETDTDSELLFKLLQLKLKYVCVDLKNLKKIIAAKKNFEVTVEVAICFDQVSEEIEVEAKENGVQIVNFSMFLTCPATQFFRVIDEKSVCMLVYTGGSTGAARCRKVTHENFMESLTSVLFESHMVNSEDKYILYGNLASFGEKLTCYYLMVQGVGIGISRNLEKDLKILQPTLMLAVPRVLDFFYKKIQQDLKLRPKISQKIFNKAIAKNLSKLIKNKFKHKQSLWDNWVFNTVKEKFGGNLRMILTGSSPPNEISIKFLKVCLGCEIIEGYGIVEAGFSNFSSNHFNTQGHLGGPLINTEAKIVKMPGLQLPNIDSKKCGELYLKNHTRNLGYIDGEIVDSDEWVRTGDIFRILDESNAFQFIERSNYCYNVKSGWTVTPQRLENIYRQSPYIAQILIYTSEVIDGIVAVVVPDENFIMNHWAPTGVCYFDICQNKLLGKAILKNFEEIGENVGLYKYEFIKDIIIETTPWTSSEYITGTLKLKRHALLEKYKTRLNKTIENLSLNFL